MNAGGERTLPGRPTDGEYTVHAWASGTNTIDVTVTAENDDHETTYTDHGDEVLVQQPK